MTVVNLKRFHKPYCGQSPVKSTILESIEINKIELNINRCEQKQKHTAAVTSGL